MDNVTQGLLGLLEERAASYGALRHSSLTAIALDRAATALAEREGKRDA